MYKKYIKRLLDFTFALITLIMMIIPFAIIAVWIKVDSKGPVFFKQKRAGKNLVPFMAYKFRSMTTDAPKNCPTNDLKNAGSYITRSGKIMRKLSIDELPQLFNVLKGEMSIVGPRPVVMNETNLFAEREKHDANSCVPGITGLAQVNGRDEVSIVKKAKMDGEYARNISFSMDAKCILMTLGAVLSLKGNKEGDEKKDFINSIKQRPAIDTKPQTIFYARLPYQAKKGPKRSIFSIPTSKRHKEGL